MPGTVQGAGKTLGEVVEKCHGDGKTHSMLMAGGGRKFRVVRELSEKLCFERSAKMIRCQHREESVAIIVLR